MIPSPTNQKAPAWWRRLWFKRCAAVVPVTTLVPVKFVISEFQPGTGILTRLHEYDTMQTLKYLECPAQCQMDKELGESVHSQKDYNIYVQGLLKHIQNQTWYNSFMEDVNDTLRWKEKRDIVASIVVGDTIVVYDLFRRACRATPEQFSALLQEIASVIPEAIPLPIYGL